MKFQQVLACHDLSEGGLGVALAEMCMAGGLGADIDLSVIDHDGFPAGCDMERDPALLGNLHALPSGDRAARSSTSRTR